MIRDEHYFKKLQSTHFNSYPSAVQKMALLNNSLAVCTGKQVDFVQNGATTSYSKFESETRCVKWRPDGQLVAVGEASGRVQLIQASKRV